MTPHRDLDLQVDRAQPPVVVVRVKQVARVVQEPPAAICRKPAWVVSRARGQAALVVTARPARAATALRALVVTALRAQAATATTLALAAKVAKVSRHATS